MTKTIQHSANKSTESVVTKALRKAADYWGINNKQLGEYIGLSESTISRLKSGNYTLEDNTKSFELAVVFLRVYRGLDAYMGGHIENEKRWLRANNKALGGAPLELMQNVEGLASVVQYIDYIRGQ